MIFLKNLLLRLLVSIFFMLLSDFSVIFADDGEVSKNVIGLIIFIISVGMACSCLYKSRCKKAEEVKLPEPVEVVEEVKPEALTPEVPNKSVKTADEAFYDQLSDIVDKLLA